jgi:hypothetical protein
MASTSKLTLYTRANPPAYGVIAFAGEITAQSGSEGAVTIEYQDKAADAKESVKLESGGCVMADVALFLLLADFRCLEYQLEHLDHLRPAYSPTHRQFSLNRASCTDPIAVIKSLADAFAALGFCGANKTESDEVRY